MKWINFNAGIAKVKYELQKACQECGFNVDPIDLSENLEIILINIKSATLTYNTTDFKVCMTITIECDRLILSKPNIS